MRMMDAPTMEVGVAARLVAPALCMVIAAGCEQGQPAAASEPPVASGGERDVAPDAERAEREQAEQPRQASPTQAEDVPRVALDDADIEGAVQNELLLSEAVPARLIDVQVSDGVATLTGRVDSLLAKRRAEAVAEAVRGVRSVIDRLQVEPPRERTDREIREHIRNALFYNAATESFELSVAVQDGVVTLTGSVESWAERRLAENVAAAAAGVKAVRNRVEVAHVTQRSNAEIRADVQKLLAADARVEDALIDVRVEDGIVSLRGTVGSAAERSRAIQDAWVAGVERVRAEQLQVEWWARDRFRRDGSDPLRMKSDQAIREAVEDALLRDPRVLSYEPRIEVENGIVILRGTVESLQAKRAAVEDARNTAGVWRVRDYLKVRRDEPADDAQIEKRAREALLWDPYVQHDEVSVTVRDGVVYLSGSVGSSFIKQHAEDVVADIDGVVAVENDLVAHAARAHKADWELRQDIERQLTWDPYVYADNVSVSVEGGVARLEGEVMDWRAYNAALDCAHRAGAREVISDLSVELGGPHVGRRSE